MLYVENEPRYEYRYLNKAVLRDTSLEFACLLLNAYEPSNGNIEVREFPTDIKKLFDYDIIVLGDVPRTAFTDSQIDDMRRFVEDRGGSMLIIAGEEHMPHEYAGTPLEAVMPVVISPTPEPLRDEEPFRWQRTPEGKRSPIMQLEDDPARNEEAWNSLRGMLWAAGVPRAKPGATVLAVHPTRRNADGPYPLVAVQPFGAGQMLHRTGGQYVALALESRRPLFLSLLGAGIPYPDAKGNSGQQPLRAVECRQQNVPAGPESHSFRPTSG